MIAKHGNSVKHRPYGPNLAFLLLGLIGACMEARTRNLQEFYLRLHGSNRLLGVVMAHILMDPPCVVSVPKLLELIRKGSVLSWRWLANTGGNGAFACGWPFKGL